MKVAGFHMANYLPNFDNSHFAHAVNRLIIIGGGGGELGQFSEVMTRNTQQNTIYLQEYF